MFRPPCVLLAGHISLSIPGTKLPVPGLSKNHFVIFYYIKTKKSFNTINLKIILIINIILLSILSAQSQRYNTSDGLSQSVVNAICQDSKGFLWVGTQDGLNLFDGHSFKVFRHDPLDSSSISNNYIWRILEDSKKRLWICTYGGGLELYDRQKSEFVHHLKSGNNSINGNDVRSIFEDDSELIWVGTNNGLNSYDVERNKWTDFSSVENPSVPFKNIRWIYPHSKNLFWLLSYESGLILFDKISHRSKLYSHDPADKNSLPINQVWQLIKDQNDIYWLATYGGGLLTFDSKDYEPFGNIKFKRVFNKEFHKNITSLFETAAGDILVGTETPGLRVVRNGKLEKSTFDNPNQNSSGDLVWSMCSNNSGGYWLGLYGGGLKYINPERTKFNHIPASVLSNPIVFSIKKFQEDFFIGTYGGGLNIIDHTHGLKIINKENSALTTNYITDIEVESNSSIWIGTDDEGIFNFNPENGDIKHFTTKNSQLPNHSIKAIYKDSKYNIWVGTTQGMVNLQSPEKVSKKYFSNKFFPRYVRAILEISEGILLIGTDGFGIYRFDLLKNKIEKYGPKELADLQVNALYADSSGVLWIGTRSKGLYKFNDNSGKIINYSERDGICNNSILAIEADEYGFLWMTTNNGIARCNPTTEKIHNYYTVDGLTSNEFVHGALFKDKDGLLYAGSTNGAVIINPDNFRMSTFNPQLEITKLKVLNNYLPLSELSDGELELSYKENFIQIDFASLDLSNPSKNQYRYKITPGTDGWVNLGTEHKINFANLNPNSYLLEISGSNSDGVWSPNTKQIWISISPPFYNTFWFYSLIGLIVSLLAYAYHLLTVRKNVEMERLRLKLASDLHDEVGASLSQIAINANMINYDSNLDKIKRRGEVIMNKSSEIITSMNDVIWSIDSRNDRMENLIEKIKSTVAQLASNKEIKTVFDINIENPARKLNVEFRQNIYLVIKEAVNNAVKYSGCDTISVTIKEKENVLELTVSDNGTGLTDKPKETGNGLRNMKYRIEKIHGNINFKNDCGCKIHVKVKIK
ncbi:MAG: hypothetical protein D6830_00955 [Ignavibacteria bacterium]|nr:MAG: hypothetical protein D6830_00955 [Ignavibacteria bacterium]